jgi:uncharacterized protein
MASHRPPSPPRRKAAAPRGAQPLSPRELDELQALLDRVPAPLEPLDVSMLDGFLCGVLVQPQPLAPSRWLPYVSDVEGRPLPRGFDAARLTALVARRHAELDAAIARRRWFDPWVFELDEEPAEEAERHDAAAQAEAEDAATMPPEVDAVYPWVAGFATALELFPALLEAPQDALTEPLVLLYRHLAPEDLEDADELLAEIETLEPPADLGEAVEGLVRATLLLADVGRPLPAAARPPPRPR